MENRETFGSRLGFLLISAGCAIGIGNVWKFPYITGLYGGGAFVLIYLFFLIAMGVPLMTMEFAVGRASRKSPLLGFKQLQKNGHYWHLQGYVAMIGNYILMMFYTTVTGWMLHYFYLSAKGSFVGQDVEHINSLFGAMLGQPFALVFWMVVVVIIGFLVCSIGLQAGVEKITKNMMLALFGLIVLLAIKSITLPNAVEGLKFYLLPDFNRMKEVGIGATIVAAMNQSFFTLSLGIGSIAIFGSYIGREHTLFGESLRVAGLDTMVAIFAGLIIFPACASFGVKADSGPNLIFITLPNIFNHMVLGRLWGSLFFLFMAFATFSTVIAVFETILSCCMDLTGCSRKKGSYVNIVLMILLSLPCALGFNVLSNIHPLGGDSSFLDLEDFIVSNVMLPLGSLLYLLFCVSKSGWGWKAFKEEADTGNGVKIPSWLRLYSTFLLPLIILFIFVIGIKDKFF